MAAGRAQWDGVGMFGDPAAYERFMGRWSARLAPAFLEEVGLGDPAAVVDVGCGTGNLALAVAERWPSARVTGVDPSTAFVLAARERAGSSPVRFEVGDAQDLPLPSGCFDASLACLVLNFVPNPSGALAEMSRVTRAGGTVAACVWDYSDGMSMLREMWDAVASVGLDAGHLDERRMPLGHAEALASLLTTAGLGAVTDGDVVVQAGFSSFDDYWDPFLGGQGAGGQFVASLAEEERTRVRDEVHGRLGDGPFVLPLRAWFARATVPGSERSGGT